MEILVARARRLDGFRAIHLELADLFDGDPEEVWRCAQPLYQAIAGLPEDRVDDACLGLKRVMERMLRLEGTNPQARANLRQTLKDLVDTTICSSPQVRAEILQRIAHADREGVEGLDVLLNALQHRNSFRGTDYVLEFGERRGRGFQNVKAVELDRGEGTGRGVDLAFKNAEHPADPYSPTHFEFKSGPDQDMSPKQSMLHLFVVDDWKRYRVVMNADGDRIRQQAARLLSGASENPLPSVPAGAPVELHMGLLETMRAHRNEEPWRGMIADLTAHSNPGFNLDQPFDFLTNTGTMVSTGVTGRVLDWASTRFFESFVPQTANRILLR